MVVCSDFEAVIAEFLSEELEEKVSSNIETTAKKILKMMITHPHKDLRDKSSMFWRSSKPLRQHSLTRHS
jgi:hypothetical protein